MPTHHLLEGKKYRADELGEATMQGAWWRRACFAALGLVALSLCGNLYQTTLRKERVHYIEIDTRTGDARVVGPAPDHYDPPQSTIHGVLRDDIVRLWSVLQDKEFQRTWQQELWNYRLTDKARHQLATFLTEARLRQREPVKVEVVRIVRRGPTHYDLRWRETVHDPSGTPLPPTTYSGLAAVGIRAPRTEAERAANPAGVWIDELAWSKE